MSKKKPPKKIHINVESVWKKLSVLLPKEFDLDLDKLAQHFQTFESSFVNLLQTQLQRPFIHDDGVIAATAEPRPWLIVDKLTQELEAAQAQTHDLQMFMAEKLRDQERDKHHHDEQLALDDLRKRFEAERQDIELLHRAEIDALHAKITELEVMRRNNWNVERG